MKYCHFSGKFRLKAARFVFKRMDDVPVRAEGVKVSADTWEIATLKEQYEMAKSDLLERLERDESLQPFRPFVKNAKERLAQCDSDLKRYDVLKPDQIRKNLAAIRRILFEARMNDVNKKKNDVVEAINKRKEFYLNELSKRLKEQKVQLADMPGTLGVAMELNGKTVWNVNKLFDDRVQKVGEWVAQLMSRTGDMNTAPEDALKYLNSVEQGLTSDEAGAMNVDAKALYNSYDEQVTGEYLHEKARSGKLESEIEQVCADLLEKVNGNINRYVDLIRNEDPKNYGKINEYNRILKNEQEKYKNLPTQLDQLKREYIEQIRSCKGREKHKQTSIVYGDFLNEFNHLRDQYFPDEEVKGRRDYQAAALARTNAIRTDKEKGWNDLPGTFNLDEAPIKNVAYPPERMGVVNGGSFLRVGPEDPNLSGVIIDYAKKGDMVRIADVQPLKVKGLEYVRVQVLNKNGQVLNEGWMNRQRITYKFGAKPEKAIEKKAGEGMVGV